MIQVGGSSERRALGVDGMSASVLRYQPVPDRNAALREPSCRLPKVPGRMPQRALIHQP
jgi:hypothetical protein